MWRSSVVHGVFRFLCCGFMHGSQEGPCEKGFSRKYTGILVCGVHIGCRWREHHVVQKGSICRYRLVACTRSETNLTALLSAEFVVASGGVGHLLPPHGSSKIIRVTGAVGDCRNRSHSVRHIALRRFRCSIDNKGSSLLLENSNDVDDDDAGPLPATVVLDILHHYHRALSV